MALSSRIQSITDSYNQRASEYDSMSRAAYPWLYFDKPYIEEKVVPVVDSDTRLLEVGSGSGKVLELFDNKISHENITGIDLSSSLIEIAKKKFSKSTFIIGDFTETTLPSQPFDIALSIRSIEYLDQQSLIKGFRNVYDSLVENGTFFIVTGHPLRINNGDISTYLSRGPRTVSLPWGMKVDLYHKTVSDILMATIEAGFQLAFIDEPEIPLALQEKDPKQYTEYTSYGAINLHLVLTKH